MTAEDLSLAVERHATSKLDDEDLLQIRTLGFRGEALPSIGSVARLSITTRHASEPHAWALTVEGGEKSEIMPAALAHGTRVEVNDLFYATPARLKFLKTDRTEAEAIREVVRRLAMARPDIAFTLAGEERAPVTWAAALPGAAGRLTRLGDILGADFRSHAIEVHAEREGVVVAGYAAAPVADQGQRARAISLRQRPPGARQADPRRGARGLCRLSAARPASGAGAVRHARSARGRRQRASGQDRGALPQCRPRARADRARAEGRPGARGPAHRRQQRRERAIARSARPSRRAPAKLGLAGSPSAPVAPMPSFDGAAGARLRRARAGRVRCRRAERRRAVRDAARGRSRRPSARRGAHAAPRDLYRLADPRRPDHRRPACRA